MKQTHWLVCLAGLSSIRLFAPSHMGAQSVSPPIAEYSEKARSSFQLSNPSIFPLTVVLEPRGFTVTEDGEVVDLPIDTSRIRIKLSDMSFRIPPRGTRTVFYEASSDSLPTWFNILSALSGAKTESGLNVRILLPHVVYLNQKQPLRKSDVAIRAFEFDSARKTARVLLENLSPNLGRVYQTTVGDGHNVSQPGSGFPLLPRKQRWAEVTWDQSTIPNRVMLRFSRFSLDTVLTPAAARRVSNPTAASGK
jgi:hypothetical protein